MIWVEGKNGGKLIAHEAGLLGLMSVQLDPHGTLALTGNKYPITGIGIGNLLSKLIEKGGEIAVYQRIVRLYLTTRQCSKE